MNNTQLTQFIINSITRNYFQEVAYGAFRPGQVKRTVKQVAKDYNPYTQHVLRFEHPRMQEIMMPGHTRRRERVETQRKRNREQINFFCRYVLAKKGKTIPYN